MLFLLQEALVAAETNSKEVKKHNHQVSTKFVFSHGDMQWLDGWHSGMRGPGLSSGQDHCGAWCCVVSCHV